MPLVLVTGATGEVGRAVLPFLEKEFDLRLLSLDRPDDDPRRVQADLLDWEALARAMNGVSTVLHLAVASGHSGAYEDDAFNDQRFDVNVKGTYHVFEAARRARVRRVVHVSSLMVVWGHGLLINTLGEDAEDARVDGEATPFPLGTYALTKTLAEEIAWHYGAHNYLSHAMVNVHLRRPLGDPWHSAKYPHEVITLRIAAPLDITDPELTRKPVRPQQVPVPDLVQAFEQALRTPLHKYEVVTIVGDSSRRIWDLTAARRVLGYRPRYYLDDLGVTFADPFSIEPS
jgi:nucleoside-diphosphate-sugar epimerase